MYDLTGDVAAGSYQGTLVVTTYEGTKEKYVVNVKVTGLTSAAAAA